jgi:Protein of unknown function (DUF2589)
MEQIGDPEALYLYQLIGAPLLAVVQAEVQAAQASAEFIRKVGFDTGRPVVDSTGASALQDGGELGPLRIAKFSQTRIGPDGKPQDVTIQIPVLSLFPIPLLQVKTADFDFGVRILSRVPLEGQKAEDAKVVSASGKLKPEDFLSPGRVELKGSVSRHSEDAKSSSEMHMKVRIHMDQADIPAGLLTLFNLMGQSVTTQPKPKEPAVLARAPDKQP